jgi:hypothetical protein
MSNFRKYTNLVIDALDGGTLDPRYVIMSALGYFSEDDIKDMCLANDILFEEEDEEVEEDEEATRWYIAYNIDWDLDDDDIILPDVMRVAVNHEDDVGDAISDIVGYCHNGYECKLEEEYYEEA